MQKVGVYIRVSSDIQAKEGDSIPAQREALRRYVDEHSDLVLAGEYIDDGVSGQKFEQRGELQRMLQDAREHKIDLILCTKLDRLFRSVRHYAATQELLDSLNIKWKAIFEPIYDTTTPAGQLIVNQMMSFAQFEAQNTGQRIRQVQAYKVQKGEVISGSTPPGYTIKDKRLIPNENAPYIKQAFERYSKTGNLHQTLLFCRDMPEVPKHQPSFKQMLQNTKYIGLFRENQNFCEPIISKSLFYDVQRKLEINVKSSQKRIYIFPGLIVCGECGRRMSSYSRTYHRKKGEIEVRFYRCPKHFMGIPMCSNAKCIRENVLERYLIEHIKTELQKYILDCEIKAAPAKDNQKKIAALEKKISRLKELYINELISLDEYKADKEHYQNEISELKKEEAPEPVDTSELEKILNLDIAEIYYPLPPEQKRYFWRSIIKEIRFDVDRKLTIFF